MNRAGKIGVRMGLVLALVLSGIMGSVAPVAASEPVNEVQAQCETHYHYLVLEDTFQNQQVEGKKDWVVKLHNRVDETEASVTGLALTLASELDFGDVWPDPDIMGPPTYEWSFDDVPEESGIEARVGSVPVSFIPGLSATRTVEPTVFSEPGTQNLTITVTPEEDTTDEQLVIIVGVPDHPGVSSVITDVEVTAEGIERIIQQSEHHVNIDLRDVPAGTTCTATIKIQVTPIAHKVEFIPQVGIIRIPLIPADTIIDSSVTLPSEIGPWTWRADGSYEWKVNTGEWIHRSLEWEPSCREIVNQVEAYFGREWIYLSPGDTFENHQVEGKKEWRVKLHNSPDETGAPLTGLALTLASEWEFDDLYTAPDIMGPPTYEWSFPDVPEGSELVAWVGSVPVTFTPGFDASRSVDITEFLQSEGTQTQTLTITLTPRDVTEGIRIHVIAGENDLVAPVITSPTGGEGVWLFADGHQLVIEPKGLESGTTYTYTVTIEVTPKVTRVEFIPFVSIPRHEVLASGSTTASSVSYTSEIGTWTWSAEGSYEWHWKEMVEPIVHWQFWSREIVPVARASVDTYLAPVGSPFTFFGVASTGPIESYEWNFDDGTSDSGLCVAHAYAAPGLYDVVLTVTDDIALTDTDTVMVVVYDPEAGFVTGGGWIYSDAGADRMNPSAKGKATFGFVSKYKKGATEPTGQTQFQFKAGDLNFHSTEYQWLVVNENDTNAQFKGTGTINGTGVYKFMLWAGDGDPDTFRIKIWEEGENGMETVRYDNGSDQPIGGGSIVIHKK